MRQLHAGLTIGASGNKGSHTCKQCPLSLSNIIGCFQAFVAPCVLIKILLKYCTIRKMSSKRKMPSSTEMPSRVKESY